MSILGGLMQAGGYALQARPKTYDAYGIAAAKVGNDAAKKKGKENEQIQKMFQGMLQKDGANLLPFQQEPFTQKYAESFADAMQKVERGDYIGATNDFAQLQQIKNIYVSNRKMVDEFAKNQNKYVTSNEAIGALLTNKDPEQVQETIRRYGSLFGIQYDENSGALSLQKVSPINIESTVNAMMKNKMTELGRQTVGGIPVLTQSVEEGVRRSVAQQLSNDPVVQQMYLRKLITRLAEDEVDILEIPETLLKQQAKQDAEEDIYRLTEQQRATTYRFSGSGGGREQQPVEGITEGQTEGTVNYAKQERDIDVAVSAFYSRHGIERPESSKAFFNMAASTPVQSFKVNVTTTGYDASSGKSIITPGAISGDFGQMFVAPVFTTKGKKGWEQLDGAPIEKSVENNEGAMQELKKGNMVRYEVLATIKTQVDGVPKTYYVPASAVANANILGESNKDKSFVLRKYDEYKQIAESKNGGSALVKPPQDKPPKAEKEQGGGQQTKKEFKGVPKGGF